MKDPDQVQSDFPIGRLTTIKTGGRAQFFARASERDRLVELLSWANGEGLGVGVIGSGSNLLVADEGVQGLVLKLEGNLASIEEDEDRLICGGGARLPQVSARAAALGLSGIEFGVSIPGTVGGAVKMNANAFGGDLGSVLEWADVATPGGIDRRGPDDFDFRYRSSNLGPREVVASASFLLSEAPGEDVKAAIAEMRASRLATQPSGVKTFGSTFKNPEGEEPGGRTAGELLEAAGCKDLKVGGARFSRKHANFIENTGDATTGDVIELMVEARRRVYERFRIRLEPEVQFMGDPSATRELWG